MLISLYLFQFFSSQMGVPGGTTGLIFTPVPYQIKYHKAEAVAGKSLSRIQVKLIQENYARHSHLHHENQKMKKICQNSNYMIKNFQGTNRYI